MGLPVSVPEQPSEPLRSECGVPDRVLDVGVAKVGLNCPSVHSVIRERLEACLLTGPREYFAEPIGRHRGASLGYEDVGGMGMLAAQLPERPKLRAG